MIELLEDEKHVLYMLSQYGPLLIPQLHKFLHNKSSSQQARIVKNLASIICTGANKTFQFKQILRF